MKKQICAVLLCLLTLTALTLTASAAEKAPALTMQTSREGSTLTVTVGVSGMSGAAGYDLTLAFCGEALSPSGSPAPGAAWASACLEYEAGEGTLHLACVSAENVSCGGALFTAAFTVLSEEEFDLSVSGSACTEDEQLLSLLPASAAGDLFAVRGKALADGSVSASVVSCGSGYHGQATAILACYQAGRFVGCRIESLTVAENGETALSFDAFGPSGAVYRLLLTDASFRPLLEAVTVG